jgi:hypothetical protein
MSSSKKLQSQVKSALTESDEIKELLNKVLDNQAKFQELLLRLDQRQADSSAKLDAIGIDKLNIASTSKAKSAGKPAVNIMTYFKNLFTSNPEALYHIISKQEIEDTYAANIATIKEKATKKNPTADNYKASLIYTTFIKENKVRGDRVRVLMAEENHNNTVVDSEIAEHNIDDTDKESDSEKKIKPKSANTGKAKTVNKGKKVVVKPESSDEDSE